MLSILSWLFVVIIKVLTAHFGGAYVIFNFAGGGSPIPTVVPPLDERHILRAICIYTVDPKKHRYFSFIILPDVDRFSIVFHLWIQQEISNKTLVMFPTIR